MLRELIKDDFEDAVRIFTECFADDPLHIFAFPDPQQRIRLTKLMYEFVVLDLVPEMNMKMSGYFAGTELSGVIVFSPFDPERKWTDNLQNRLEIMKLEAKDERINLIGEFARESGNIKLPFKYFYANELAVLKKYRGKGIGRKLLNSAETEAFESGLHHVVLDTTRYDNTELYLRWGYNLFAEYLFHDLKCYKMFKVLN